MKQIVGQEKGFRYKEILNKILKNAVKDQKKRILVFSRFVDPNAKGSKKFSSATEFSVLKDNFTKRGILTNVLHSGNQDEHQ